MSNITLSHQGYNVSSLDELKQYVPAAFAEQYDPKRSEKYSFLPTSDLVKTVTNLGWEMTSAKQDGASIYSRHNVKFTHPGMGYMNIDNDKVRPQIIIDNSHNGLSAAQLHVGLFRLVCSNGLVIAIPGLGESMRFRHMGADPSEIKKVIELAEDQYKTISSRVNDMQDVKMHQDDKEQFAIKALTLREPHLFIKPDGTVDLNKLHESTDVNEIIKPIRGEDEADNLWSVFNVIQERMIKGGYNRKSENGRNSKTRGVSNGTRNIQLNKKLWTVAEELLIN